MVRIAKAETTTLRPREEVAELPYPSTSLWQDAWQRLIRNKAAVVGMIIIILFVFIATFAPFLAPHNPLKINDGLGYLPPAWVESSAAGVAGDSRFILGTDTIGRDVLSRVIYGARVSMVVGLTPVAIILVIGSAIGLLSGYAGGRMDNVLMRITDVFYAFPNLLLYVILMVTLRDTTLGRMFNGLFLLFVALALVSWVGVARLVRSSVLTLKGKEFIEAARCLGASDKRIMTRHILPNSLSPLIVWMALAIPGMIIAEAILGYLGLGLRPASDPNAFFITSWGSLMLEGQSAINIQPYILLVPSICVGLVVLAFTFLGDGLRDALDPRMRGSR
ncbi:MAG TPA: ABC transporter permease [candidate division Zixibacteria bacterium]|nr:ABC transporter permease [candidate division Zixibacteria bacterium]